MYIYKKLLIYDFKGTIYLHKILKNVIMLLFYFLYHILNRSKLEPDKFINLYYLLIYRVLIYRSSTVTLFYTVHMY